MPIIKSAYNIAQAVLDFALPPKCLSCKSVVDKHGNLCSECWKTVGFIGKHKCHICGLPFEFDMGEKALCQACEAKKPKFNQAVAFCKYEGVARKMVIALKFSDGVHLAPHMAKMMLGADGGLIAKADIIAPVPLHFWRKFHRKYNQASLLALNIARQSGKTYEPLLLKRNKRTQQQTRLHRKDRKANVAGAFVTSKADIKGKTILLVDDVMTTGSTISACAKTLKEQGAKTVYCLVFARVLDKH